MAQAQAADDNVVAAAYPEPPPFYKSFTAENIERLKDIKEAAASKDIDDGQANAESPAAQLLELPPELRYLVPPQPPTDGRYRTFGDRWNINELLPSLKEWGQEQLFPSPPTSPATDAPDGQAEWTLDGAMYLKKISRSILLNFLELIGILAANPTQYASKVDHLHTLVLNAYQLINHYRPHQARETLILLMEEQLARKQAEVDGVKRMKEKIEAQLSELGKEAADVIPDVPKQKILSAEEKRKTEQRNMWQALNSELDS